MYFEKIKVLVAGIAVIVTWSVLYPVEVNAVSHLDGYRF